MDFKEWLKKHEREVFKRNQGCFGQSYVFGAKNGFEAGQQSKQDEIEHRTQVSAELAGELIRKRAEIDALKKRIDEAKEEINSFFDNQTQKPTDREYCNKLADILELLK